MLQDEEALYIFSKETATVCLLCLPWVSNYTWNPLLCSTLLAAEALLYIIMLQIPSLTLSGQYFSVEYLGKLERRLSSIPAHISPQVWYSVVAEMLSDSTWLKSNMNRIVDFGRKVAKTFSIVVEGFRIASLQSFSSHFYLHFADVMRELLV